MVCRWHACFFNNHQAAQNNPVECYCFVSPIHTDELCNSVRIGRLYRVLGISAHVHQWPSITWSVEANNVQPWEPECKAVNDSILFTLHYTLNNFHILYPTLCIVTVFKHLPSDTTLPTDPHKVSARFQELLKATAGSPWRFPAVVAQGFGLDMAYPGLYNTLKLCLLLSLVQTRADAKDTFHSLDLLVFTTDTLITDRYGGLHDPTFAV